MLPLEVEQKVQELLELAKKHDISVLGVIDTHDTAQCNIFKRIGLMSKPGIRNLNEVVMSQQCSGDLKDCHQCHMTCNTTQQPTQEDLHKTLELELF
ncbi:hypothetical protein N9R79_03380 [Vibrio sp.]|nr:hypothetical protein [Vibrio sp.]